MEMAGCVTHIFRSRSCLRLQLALRDRKAQPGRRAMQARKEFPASAFLAQPGCQDLKEFPAQPGYPEHKAQPDYLAHRVRLALLVQMEMMARRGRKAPLDPKDHKAQPGPLEADSRASGSPALLTHKAS